ncbi:MULTISPECIES: hypothetical protein [unclassified Streptomyces]
MERLIRSALGNWCSGDCEFCGNGIEAIMKAVHAYGAAQRAGVTNQA